MPKTLIRLLALAATAAALAACGGGGSSDSGGTPSLSATLDWDANTEPDLAGYKIYRSTVSGGSRVLIGVVPKGTTTYTATGLQSGTTYYFVVTAYNTSFGESAFSNEVGKAM